RSRRALQCDKYQDDIDDPQQGFRCNVVEPPQIPQTLTSFNLGVHLWSSLHDFVIGNGTWQATKASPRQRLGSSQFAALAYDADIRETINLGHYVRRDEGKDSAR